MWNTYQSAKTWPVSQLLKTLSGPGLLVRFGLPHDWVQSPLHTTSVIPAAPLRSSFTKLTLCKMKGISIINTKDALSNLTLRSLTDSLLYIKGCFSSQKSNPLSPAVWFLSSRGKHAVSHAPTLMCVLWRLLLFPLCMLSAGNVSLCCSL